MRIEKIVANNFRKLKKDVTLYFREIMLLVGKNNSGKTSVYELIDKFCGNGTFLPQDFNDSVLKKTELNNLYSKIKKLKKDENYNENLSELIKLFPSISMDVFIKIDESEDLLPIKPLLFEFENNQTLILRCIFHIKDVESVIKDFDNYNLLINDESKLSEIKNVKFYDFLIRNLNKYYISDYFTTKPECEKIYQLDTSKVKELFTVSIINARRDVDDTADQNKQNISLALWEYYTYKKNNKILEQDIYNESVSAIKNKLNTNYDNIFEEIINKICSDIFIDNKIRMKVVSEINIEEILKKNSKLKYVMNDLDLSESSNGLGYSNLIYILIKIMAFKEKMLKHDRLFNILFIEEPESHLHPQLQSTFFEKINTILYDVNLITYTIISTHSSYLLQQSNLESVNYFCTNKDLCIKSLNEYINNNNREFFLKYFKLNTCDLFFADKAILIEGSVERMLFPTILSKFDSENSSNLTKQHISILEVGGVYAYIFYGLLEFLEINTLIITDNDARTDEKCKCDLTDEYSKGKKFIYTANPILKKWFNISSKFFIADLFTKKVNEFEKQIGNCRFKLVTQVPIENNTILGRTFEEELILENASVLSEILHNKTTDDLGIKFQHLRSVIDKYEIDEEKYTKDFFEKNFYEIVSNLNKTDFAIDLIISSENWKIPSYIKEGLLWLK